LSQAAACKWILLGRAAGGEYGRLAPLRSEIHHSTVH